MHESGVNSGGQKNVFISESSSMEEDCIVIKKDIL